jgi:Xylose isomerase-like TIM barrel
MKTSSPINNPSHSYVYPNVSQLNCGGRGGLTKRWELAKITGCTYIEVPADLVKNKTEVGLTGLDLGSFMDQKSIQAVYTAGSPDEGVRYILHTEPSLPRTDGYGIRHQARLRWNDPEWVDNLVTMVLGICRHLGPPAAAVEIHPGDTRNSFDDLINASRLIIAGFQKEFSTTPSIMLENRTGQFVSTGTDFRNFWNAVETRGADIAPNFGVVLDIQQLFTTTRDKFTEELAAVPIESIKGLHIHRKHGVPSIGDGIPWPTVFDWIRSIPQSIVINPEIHHLNNVPTVIEFCEQQLSD